MYGRSELDYYDDIAVIGSNFFLLQYTGKQCDLSLYSDNYEAVKGVPIVHRENDWQSLDTVKTSILDLHEVICMGDTLYHTFVNTNQLHHYGNRIQDKPMSESPLQIITKDGEFIMEPSIEVTILFANTHTHYDKKLR